MAALPAELSKVDPVEAWKPWSASGSEPWDRKRAAHLCRRAAFGAAPAEMARVLSDGFPKALDRLLTGDGSGDEFSDLFIETGNDCDDPGKLRNWWLYQMTQGGHPLREKLTLFWHNHFATSYAKILSTRLMFEQNLTLRKYALGKFRPFLLAMSKDPAMLIWLDSNRNVAGAPNENYGRELMELFSLGVGNYTEKDIREAARAFTGWHTNNEVENEAFTYRPELHDEGPKTIFGRTGNWNGEDVVRFCCEQAACPRFLVGKLYAFLVSETPPPKGLLAPLEERFRKSDYNIADLVGAMLGSRLFFSEHAYRKRVKWPVEYVLESVHAVTPSDVPNSDLLDPLAKMGQVLFAPPNVKGWRTGTDWLNSATLLARNNFAETVALGSWSKTAPQPARPGRPVRPKKPSAPGDSPAPDEHLDPVTIIYEAKPKTPADVLNRISELLYGERIAAAKLTKIEKFLNAPAETVVPAKKGPMNKDGTKTGTQPPVAQQKTVVTEAKPAPPQEAAKDAGKGPQNSAPPSLDSSAFKARVRQALHAMMCLPEYQTN